MRRMGSHPAFCAGVQDGRFVQLDDRDDLWQVLVMLTERKAIALRRRERAAKRGNARVRGESAFAKPDQSAAEGLDQIADRQPTPEFAAEVAENLRELLARLQDDSQRQAALAKLEGYTNQEVACRLRLSLRAVERKLQVIRRIWEQKGSWKGSGVVFGQPTFHRVDRCPKTTPDPVAPGPVGSREVRDGRVLDATRLHDGRGKGSGVVFG